MSKRFIRFAAYVWASPYTVLGLLVGIILGGKPRLIDGVLEIHSKRIAWLLTHMPVRAAAMTIGHVVLGQTELHLDRTRVHERVHVRQFERWGIAFGPAYVLASAICYLRGQDFYQDNPFEVEAYASEKDC